MITNIAFDVGGILLQIATPDDAKQGVIDFLVEEIGVKEDLSKLKDIVDICVPAWFSEKDVGFNIWSRYFSPEVSQQIVDKYKYFHARHYQPIPSMMELCLHLSKSYKIGILSNFAKDFVLKQNFYDQEIFNPVIFSGMVGVKKPDKRIYQIYSQASNCQPDEILFIDDNLENVESAKDFGMSSLLFTTQPNLEKDLIELNIL
jgi:HAD superfamily hydrolase (TIGR01509 family)